MTIAYLLDTVLILIAIVLGLIITVIALAGDVDRWQRATLRERDRAAQAYHQLAYRTRPQDAATVLLPQLPAARPVPPAHWVPSHRAGHRDRTPYALAVAEWPTALAAVLVRGHIRTVTR